MGEQMFKLIIEATGEVRDKDGNLISSSPVTAETVITETQAVELLERNQK